MSEGGAAKLYRMVPSYWPVVVGVCAIVFAAAQADSAISDHGKRITSLEAVSQANAVRLEHIDTTTTDMRNTMLDMQRRLNQLSDPPR